MFGAMEPVTLERYTLFKNNRISKRANEIALYIKKMPDSKVIQKLEKET